MLDSVDLTVAEKGFLSLAGPSGSGESTLPLMIAGLEAPTSGEVLVEGQPIKGPSADRGVVFQEDAISPCACAASPSRSAARASTATSSRSS